MNSTMEGSRASGMGSVDVASSSKTSCKSNSRLKVRYKGLTVLDQVGSNLSKMDRNGSNLIKLHFSPVLKVREIHASAGYFPSMITKIASNQLPQNWMQE